MDKPERRSLAVRPMRDGHWSPEEISGRISVERPDLAVSDSAICRAVESGSLDCELPGRRKAARLLRHHGRRRHRKGSQERRGKVRITHDISERPEEASSRSRTGDWEGDMVAGRQGGACLVAQAGRMSGCLVCVLSLIIVTGFVLLFFATKGQYSLLWGRRGGSCLV